MRLQRVAGLAATAAAASAVMAATVSASGSALKGTITADGSSTVGPYTTAAAEAFQKKNKDVRITVGISGTGGGFERFCKGEMDISNASRKIRQTAGSEAEKCRNAGIKYIAFAVANDGLSVVVNRDNTWANCLTTGELRKIWEPGSKVDNWRDIRPGFPDVELKLFGPGTDSGTFDYFTEEIMGKAKSSRADYQASEDDNVLVQGVSGERGGLGYFGLSYYEDHKDKLRLVAVNSGSGCVLPSTRTVQDRTYKPLGRPLFIYVKSASFKRAEVQAFVDYILKNEKAIATKSRFVPLTNAQLQNAKRLYAGAVKAAKKS